MINCLIQINHVNNMRRWWSYSRNNIGKNEMKEPLDMDKNRIRATSHAIKTLFDPDILFVKLMLQRKKIRLIGKEKNFLELLLPTIFGQLQTKEPLDLDKNQTTLIFALL
eukprot:266148_1